MFNKKWKFKKSGVSNNCVLFGVKIFDYEWHSTDENVILRDPIYQQPYTFSVYEVKIRGTVKRFAAGEVSNGVYLFYTQKWSFL